MRLSFSMIRVNDTCSLTIDFPSAVEAHPLCREAMNEYMALMSAMLPSCTPVTADLVFSPEGARTREDGESGASAAGKEEEEFEQGMDGIDKIQLDIAFTSLIEVDVVFHVCIMLLSLIVFSRASLTATTAPTGASRALLPDCRGVRE